jgi:hypothetical protein
LFIKGSIMNTRSLKSTGAFALVASIAVFAALVSTGVRADEADGSQYALRFEGTRTRADVMAEAAQVPRTRSTEPAGSRVAAPVQSTVDRAAVRRQAGQALREGKIPQGEAPV